MPLNLSELLKKATTRGIGTVDHQQTSQIFRPWQQESTLFSSDDNKKAATKRQQSGNKLITNRQQTNNKPITNRQQNVNNKLDFSKNDNKAATQSTTNIATNRQQTDNKSITQHSFSSLVGLQRILTIFIYNECKTARSKTTESLTLEHISKMVNSSMGCIKTTLQRLEAKNLIERIEYKNGRGGWSKYSISDQHFQEILQYETSNKLITNWQQIDNKSITQPATQPTTELPSSSGKEYLNTTTTREPEKPNNPLTEEWLNINIEPLANINFTKTHLTQIASQNILTTDIVQHSIYAFAFDLKENNKAKNIKNDPINFFMGILRNGSPYTPPSNYESPKDKAMRLYNESMLKAERGRVEAEKQAIDLAFNDWFLRLTDEQKIEFLPDMLRRNITSEKLGKNKMLEGAARSHFEAGVWPDLKNKIFSGAETSAEVNTKTTETKAAEQGEEVNQTT